MRPATSSPATGLPLSRGDLRACVLSQLRSLMFPPGLLNLFALNRNRAAGVLGPSHHSGALPHLAAAYPKVHDGPGHVCMPALVVLTLVVWDRPRMAATPRASISSLVSTKGM